MIGLFSAPAEMRAPSLAVTPVRLKYTMGNSAALCSRTYCPAASARNFPTVICGFFFNASASACRRVKEIPAALPGIGAACAGGVGVCVVGQSVLSCSCCRVGCGDCPPHKLQLRRHKPLQ